MKQVIILLLSITALLYFQESFIPYTQAQTLSPMNITIRAKGTICSGLYPTMVLKAGELEVMRWAGIVNDMKDYTHTSRITYPGPVTIVFENDCYKQNIEDRNLFIDYIIVNGNKIEAESEGVKNHAGTGEWLFWTGKIEFPIDNVDDVPPIPPTSAPGVSIVPTLITTPSADPCQPVENEISVICGPPVVGKCTDLQKAIDGAVQPGTRIVVEPGTCTPPSGDRKAGFNIFNRKIFITTTGKAEDFPVVIDTGRYSTGIDIQKSSVFISGVEINGAAVNELISILDTDGTEMQYIKLSNSESGGTGIRIKNSYNSYIYNSLLKAVGTAVNLNLVNTAVLFNNRIKGSNIGILSQSSKIYVNHNLFYANKERAIELYGTNTAEIVNNTVVENGPSNQEAPIVDNTLDTFGNSSLLFRKNNIVNNKSSGPETAGIHIKNRNKVSLVIEKNNVWNNGNHKYLGIDDRTGQEGNISADPKFENTNEFCLSHDSGLINNEEYIGYRATCAAAKPPMPTKPVATPQLITPVPSIPDTCVCSENDVCDTSCVFERLTCDNETSCNIRYTQEVKCNREASGMSISSKDIKDSYCRRYYRLSGDADGNGTVNKLDYFYYVRFVNGGKVPDDINPDFNGDGAVSVSDRNIIVRALQNIDEKTPQPPEQITLTPTIGREQPSAQPSQLPLTPTVTQRINPTPTSWPGQVCPFNHACTQPVTCLRSGGKTTEIGCVGAGLPGFCCDMNQ